MNTANLSAALGRTLLFTLVVMGAVEASAQTTPQTKTTPPQTKTTPPQTKTTPPQTKTTAPQTKATTPPTQSKTAAPQTKQPAPQTKAVTPPANQAKTAPPPGGRAANAPAQGGQTRAPGGAGGALLPVGSRGDTALGAPLVMMREVFEYERDGRRDPFVSLLSTADLRPTLSDLKLLMTVVDEPGRSVALVQDSYERKQKTLRVGTRLGRMRVASIRSDAVVFTIEEFGMNRRDSLLLRDTTRVRGR